MSVSLLAVPSTPSPERPPCPDVESSTLAFLVDARLASCARLEHRLERTRAAVARRLLDRRAYEPAGYSNPRDYAREELGLSLRSLQDLARLDRALVMLPRFDEAVTQGRLAPSRLLQVLPVVTPQTEELWLGHALRHTCERLAELVRAARSRARHAVGSDDVEGDDGRCVSSSSDGSSGDGCGRSGDDGCGSSSHDAFGSYDHDPDQDSAPEVELRLRQPRRSRLVWEAFVDEAARAAGHPLTDGQALELLLAEFRPLLPPTAAAGSVDQPTPAGLSPDPPSTDAASSRLRRPLEGALEALPHRASSLRHLDAQTTAEAMQLLRDTALASAEGAETETQTEPEAEAEAETLAPPILDQLAIAELQRHFLHLRRRLRRLAIEQGALLHLLRTFALYRALDFADFELYTRDRLGLGRRTAEQRADFHRAFTGEPVLRDAWTHDQISESYLPAFLRLLRLGTRRHRLQPWLERARHVNASTFRDQVRWAEACREGQRYGQGDGQNQSPGPQGPRRFAHGLTPPGIREWARIRAAWNRRPDLLVWIACGWQISARGEIEGPDGTPLAPAPTEPAGVTRAIRAPATIIQTFLDTVEAIRARLDPALPPWWCLEYMILHVRRDWARESHWAARRTEGYDILERDGFRCSSPGCRSSRNLQIHHIRFRSHGGTDHPDNLTTLCAACHQFVMHRIGTLEVRGRAPQHLVWRMGTTKYVGEFRR